MGKIDRFGRATHEENAGGETDDNAPASFAHSGGEEFTPEPDVSSVHVDSNAYRTAAADPANRDAQVHADDDLKGKGTSSRSTAGKSAKDTNAKNSKG